MYAGKHSEATSVVKEDVVDAAILTLRVVANMATVMVIW